MAIKKIVIEKEDGVGEVVDRILAEPDRALIVVVPKGSMLGKSARNFHMIKREATDAGKEVSIESVDEHILAFANNAGMAVGHPLLRERGISGTSGISDIVPVVRDEAASRGKKRAAAPRGTEQHARKLSIDGGEVVGEGAHEAAEEDGGDGVRHEEEVFLREEDRFFKKHQPSSVDEMDEEEVPSRTVNFLRARVRWTIRIVVVVVVLAVALYGITVVFGSAKINITFKKTPWGYGGNFTADKSASRVNAANDVIPAQVFSVPKNVTQLFPASGNQNVSLKAQGIITIYNAYSSSQQTLVATTRFVTPDGKIFRLVNSVVVPGAAVTNGAIVPSSITAPVVADQAGPDYNVSSTQKLTIPGFEKTPKYNAFYGSLANGTSGGFIGLKAVATAADITAAKQKVTDILTSSLQNALTGSYTNNFKILSSATNIQITKLTVNTSTDVNGNFSVYGEGVLSAIGFDETAFKAFLLSLAQSIEASSTFSDLALNYSNVMPDFANGKLGFSVSAQGSLEPIFSASDFSQAIAGKKISDTRDAISGLPELQEGAISVWPAWLWQIPGNTKKIQITTN